jgi:hypothetical protein
VDGLLKVGAASGEQVNTMKIQFMRDLANDEHVWVLIYTNFFCVAMAEKHRIHIDYLMSVLTAGINHHYARVYAEEQGIGDFGQRADDEDDDRDVRKKFGL